METSRTLYLALLLGCAPLFTGCPSPPPSIGGGAGFVDAYFDAATLNSLMSDASCVKLRFYDARRSTSDTKGTAMAIAIKSDGSEIYNGTTLKYRMYERISGSSTSITQLLKADAITRVRYVKDAGDNSYCAEWAKADIALYLASAGCNGVRLIPERLGSGIWSIRMHPVKLASDAATVLPAPSSSICTEPCPTFCGPTPNYIHL